MTDTPASAASRTLAEEQETPFEHLVIRDVDSVQEYVDARLHLSSRPSVRELEEGFPHNIVRALSREHHHHEKHRQEESDDDENQQKRYQESEDNWGRECMKDTRQRKSHDS